MIDLLGDILFDLLGPVILQIALWPIAMALCTPFILLVALCSALFDHGNFFEELGRGYRGVSRFVFASFDSR